MCCLRFLEEQAGQKFYSNICFLYQLINACFMFKMHNFAYLFVRLTIHALGEKLNDYWNEMQAKKKEYPLEILVEDSQ